MAQHKVEDAMNRTSGENTHRRFRSGQQRHSTLARNELGPLLEQLICQLGKEGRTTHRAYFDRIRRSLDCAQDEEMLAQPIIALTTCNAVGIELSDDAEPLHQRIVEKAALMITLLENAQPPSH